MSAQHPTDPAEFMRFHLLLTKDRPEYEPHYIKVNRGDSVNEEGEPTGKAATGKHTKLTVENAVNRLKRGTNIGIAAREGGDLVIIDIDDPDVIDQSELKPTLTAMSRSRDGYHYFYYAADSSDKRVVRNTTIKGVGEIRSSNYYTVAPGSWVDTADIADKIPADQIENAGKYTVESDLPVASISYEELPQAFRDHIEAAAASSEAAREIDREHAAKRAERIASGRGYGGESALNTLTIEDVICGSHTPSERFKNPLHPGTKGTYAQIGDGLMMCYACGVTHTPLSAIAVMAGVATCESGGKAFGSSTAGASSINWKDDGVWWVTWAYAIQNGIIPLDDPISWDTITHYATTHEICKPEDLIDGWKLPAGAVAQTKAMIREKEGIEIINIHKRKPKPATPKPVPKAETDKAPVADMACTDRLIESGSQGTVFFHTPDDTCYAAVELDSGGSAILPVATKGKFAKILRQRYYTATGKAPQPDALKNAINTLEAIAWGNGDVKTLHNRVAWQDGGIVYDLTNNNYEAIEITSRGWGLMAAGHILFKRYGHQIAQVPPISGGDPWRLFEFVNVAERDRLLAMVYLISCFVPGIAHVIPIITGEHGTAKTTTSDMFKSLVDPSAVMGGVSMPVNEDRFNLMLSQHWFVIFDNIDWIQRWQSEALCRSATGQSSIVRSLYTNEEVTVFKYKICVGLNGINNAATKPDLLDRAIFLNLDRIKKRIPEVVLWDRFNEAKPLIIGGMFDILSKAMLIYQSIHVDADTLPRMADFAKWGCAIAVGLGYTQDEFLSVYEENIGRVNRAALEASPVAVAIMAFMEDRKEWVGTPAELLRELEMLAIGLYIDTKSKSWAKSPESLGRRMKTVIPNLQRVGICFERGKSGKRTWRLFYLSKELSNLSNLSTVSDNHKNTNCPTCPTCPTDRVRELSTCPDSGQVDIGKKHHQAGHLGSSVILDGSAPYRTGGGVCGNCGCELSGQTFRGPAGLGKICADCQAGLDTDRGTQITDAIFRSLESENHEFTVAEVLIKQLPKKAGFTTEEIELFMNAHSNDMKIERMGGGRWRQAGILNL